MLISMKHNYSMFEKLIILISCGLSYVAFTDWIADSSKAFSRYCHHHINSSSADDTLKWEPKVWVCNREPVRLYW